MAKLQKRPSNRPQSNKSTKSKWRKSDPTAVPVVNEQSAHGTPSEHASPNNGKQRSGNEVIDLHQESEALRVSRPAVKKPYQFIPQPARAEQDFPPGDQLATSRPPSSRQAYEATEPVVAGPSEHRSASQPRKCGPACQKCGRPRRSRSPNDAVDEIRPARHAEWPLPQTGAESLSNIPQTAPEKPSASGSENVAPYVVPDQVVPTRRRKYFSLPIASKKTTFKGPLELGTVKGKDVEPVQPSIYRESREYVRPYTETREKPRSTSTPPPKKSSFAGPVDIISPRPLGKNAAHVRFATDDALGQFAPAFKSTESQILPTVPKPAPSEVSRLESAKPFTPHPRMSTEGLPKRPPQDQIPEMPKNPTSVLPTLARTQPERLSKEQHPENPRLPLSVLTASAAPQRPPKEPISSKSNPPNSYEWPLITTLINQPTPRSSRSPTPTHSVKSGRVSRKASRKNNSLNTPMRRLSSRKSSRTQPDRSSYSTGDDLTLPVARINTANSASGGVVNIHSTATAPTEDRHGPSLPPLQPGAAPRIAIYRPDEYSPSDYGSVDDNLNNVPITPPSDAAQNATSVWVDDLRPFSSSVIASLLPGLPSQSSLQKTDSAVELPGTSVVSDGGNDLPELADEAEDEDWMSWGALPGSYGGAGMWTGSTSDMGLGPVELGAGHVQKPRDGVKTA